MGPGREVLDDSGQGLDLFCLSLFGGGEGGDLCLEDSNFLLQGGKAGRHRGLYFGQCVF